MSIKYICYYSELKSFAKGKFYTAYRDCFGHMLFYGDGACFNTEMDGNSVRFIPEDAVKKIVKFVDSPCLNEQYFSWDELYIVNMNDNILDNFGNEIDYRSALLMGYEFKDIINNEPQVSTKNGIIKGLGNTMVQDMFRAVTDKQKGMIQFNPVKMKNICFVQFKKDGKIYIFENPSDERLKNGTKVLVSTKMGEQDAYVVSSVKIQKKYLNSLKMAVGAEKSPLRKVLGIYKINKSENLKKFEEEQKENED